MHIGQQKFVLAQCSGNHFVLHHHLLLSLWNAVHFTGDNCKVFSHRHMVYKESTYMHTIMSYYALCMYMYTIQYAYCIHTLNYCDSPYIYVHNSSTDHLEPAADRNSSENSATINSTSTAITSPANILGSFDPHSICFHDVTQQQTYYIFLVSVTIIIKNKRVVLTHLGSRQLQLGLYAEECVHLCSV